MVFISQKLKMNHRTVLLIDTFIGNNSHNKYFQAVQELLLQNQIPHTIAGWTDLVESKYTEDILNGSFSHIILSGNDSSIRPNHWLLDTPELTEIYSWIRQIPDSTKLLGLCRGMQIIGMCFGHKIINGETPERGLFEITLTANHSRLVQGSPNKFMLYQDHYQGVDIERNDPRVIATSQNFVQIVEWQNNIFGIQGHPEYGELKQIKLIENFLIE
jgi:GMP synthase-like glutamine amidotransferase